MLSQQEQYTGKYYQQSRKDLSCIIVKGHIRNIMVGNHGCLVSEPLSKRMSERFRNGLRAHVNEQL